MSALFQRVHQPAGFAGVTFPCGKFETTGGHDFAEHSSLGRRGADLQHTGQQGYAGTFEVLLFNGLRGFGDDVYPGLRFDLLRAFETSPIGELSHPTHGTFQAAIASWKEGTDPDAANGCTLEVAWKEHLAGASLLVADPASTAADAPTSTTSQAAAADALATGTAGYTPTAPVVAAKLAFLDAAPRAYPQIAAALATMTRVVATNLALPALAGATSHPAVAALEALRGTLLALRATYLPGEARVRRYTVPVTQPLWQLAVVLYGDAAQATLLAASNRVHDPLFVRAGAVLVVPPAA